MPERLRMWSGNVMVRLLVPLRSEDAGLTSERVSRSARLQNGLVGDSRVVGRAHLLDRR